MSLELKKFDMKNISFKVNETNGPVVVLLGKRNTGKSYLVRLLQIALAKKASILSLDNYYKPKHSELQISPPIVRAQLTYESFSLFPIPR